MLILSLPMPKVNIGVYHRLKFRLGRNTHFLAQGKCWVEPIKAYTIYDKINAFPNLLHDLYFDTCKLTDFFQDILN